MEFLAVLTEPRDSRLVDVISQFFPEANFITWEKHYLTGAIFLFQEGGNINLIRDKSASEIGLIVSQEVDRTMDSFIRQMETLIPVCRDMGLIQRALIFINAVKQQVVGITLIQELLKVFEIMSGFILECIQRLKEIYRNNEQTISRLFERSNYFHVLEGMSVQDIMAALMGMINGLAGSGVSLRGLNMLLGLPSIDGPE